VKGAQASPWRVLAASTALNAPIGSLYAFSVFLQPLEALLGLTRADLAFVFALAAAAFGGGMMLAPGLYGVASTPLLVTACAVANALGLALAATAGGLAQLAIGYGVLFGLGGGAAYILVQQMVNLVVTRRQGLVNGYIVSLLPAGAMIAAPLFGWGIRTFGVRATLGGLAGVLAITGFASAWLLAHAGVAVAAETGRVTLGEGERRRAVFWQLSIVFFLAASAGLMVLSQAREIVASYGGAAALAVAATTGLTGAIALARISGGWLVDRFAVPQVMCAAHALALGGGLLITLLPAPVTAVLGLGMVGLGYGFVSGATAGGIGLYWRPADYGRVAGRTYIAWCLAAVSLPVVAGYLFDMTHQYGTAVLIAACANVAGMAMALTLPRRGWREGR
jgi:MFS transporter, OFA family, oxalate/formate antiporter